MGKQLSLSHALEAEQVGLAMLTETKLAPSHSVLPIGGTPQAGGGWIIITSEAPAHQTGLHHHGVGFALNASNARAWAHHGSIKMTDSKYPDRMLAIAMPIASIATSRRWFNAEKYTEIIFLVVYAPCDSDKHIDECHTFFKQISLFYSQIKNDHPNALIITGGDFNARVGTYDEHYKTHSGPYGMSANNTNGDLLIQFCVKHSLCIPGTFFPHKRLHTASWINARWKTEDKWQKKGVLIDHFVVPIRCRKAGLIQDVRIRYRRNEAAKYLHVKSDHRLQVMALASNIIKPPARQAHQVAPRPIPMQKRINVCIDTSTEEGKATRDKFSDKFLEIKTNHIPLNGFDDEDEEAPAAPELTPEEKLDLLQATLITTFEEVCCLPEAQAREERRKDKGITTETLAQSKQRDLLYKQVLKLERKDQVNPEAKREARTAWRSQCRKVKRLVNLDLREYHKNQIESIEAFHDGRLFGEVWKGKANIIKTHNTAIPTPQLIEDNNGIIRHGPQAVADTCGLFFKEQFNISSNTSQIPIPTPPHDLSQPVDPLPPAPLPEDAFIPLPPPQMTAPQKEEPFPSQGPFTINEVRAAIRKMKDNRAGDKKGAIAEMFKVGIKVCDQELTDIMNSIRTSHQVPTSWKEIKMKALYKRKGKREKCKNSRPISMTDIAYKIMAQVILHRLTQVMEPMLLDEHNGFRRGRSISDAIHTLQRLVEKFRNINQPLFCAFLDIKQAYDSVPRELLFRIMKEYYKIDPELVDLIEALYQGTEARIHVDDHQSPPFPLPSGVKQGCVMSPLLFTIFIDFIIRQALPVLRDHGVKLQYIDDLIDAVYQGVPVGDEERDRIYTRIITAIIYADDIAILSRSHEGLTIMLTHLNSLFTKYGLTVCMTKSKYMNIGAPTIIPTHPQGLPPIHIPGGYIDHTEEQVYLGTVISADGTATANVDRCIKLAWHIFNLNAHFLRNKKIAVAVRETVFQVTVMARLLYGAENWVLPPGNVKAIREVHNKMITSMIRLPYKDRLRIPYAERRARFANTPCVEDLLRRRQIRYAGHLLRMHDSQPRLPSITLTGRLDTELHPNRTGMEEVEEGAWAAQLRSHIFVTLKTRCNHTKETTNSMNRRHIKDKMRNKVEWLEICKTTGHAEYNRPERKCPICSLHFRSKTEMETHRRKRHGKKENSNVNNNWIEI